MTIRRSMVLCGVVLLGVAAAPGEAAAKKAIVAVFNIEDRGANLSRKMLLRLSDFLASSLAATGTYLVVPRSQLKARLVAQKKVSYKQCHDQSCQIEIGRELAANKSLSTQVMKLGSKCMVTAVMYDLRRSTSEGGARAEGACTEDGIVGSIKKILKQLVPENEAPPPATAASREGVTIDIATRPSAAELFLGGKSRGRTPLRFELSRGIYSALFEKDGYHPLRTKLRVRDRQRFLFTLSPTAEGQLAMVRERELAPKRASAMSLRRGGMLTSFIGGGLGLVASVIGLVMGCDGTEGYTPIDCTPKYSVLGSGLGVLGVSLGVGLPLWYVGQKRLNEL